MSTDDPGVSLEIFNAVKLALESRGVDLENLAPATSALVVRGTVADAMFDRAATALGDLAIGVSIIAAIPIGGFGVMDYALCTSATARESMTMLAKHSAVASQRLRLELVEHNGRARVRLERLGIAQSRHWIELSLGMMATRLRDTVGTSLSFSDVWFRHAAPQDTSTYDAHFGTHVLFDAADDMLEFDAAHLDRPLRTSSRSLALLLEACLRELAPAFATADPFLERARRAVSTMLDERRTEVDELARRLGTSTRSLQRTLGELGTSHSALLDEIRRERAAQLLDRGLRVADVADALVFAAPSAFFRAYRRWTGTSPKSRLRRVF